MSNSNTEVSHHGFSARQEALTEARLVVAQLCATERTTEYRSAISEVLQNLELMAESATQPEITATDDVFWKTAVSVVGTSKVPPYGYPVVVLARASDVSNVYKALLAQLGPVKSKAILLDGYHREKLSYATRVMCAAAETGRDKSMGQLWFDVLMAKSVLQTILGVTPENCIDVGLTPEATTPVEFQSAKQSLLAGWLEAARAWEVCASIHEAFGKKKDALFKTRQADFRRHADEARAKYTVIMESPGTTTDTG